MVDKLKGINSAIKLASQRIGLVELILIAIGIRAAQVEYLMIKYASIPWRHLALLVKMAISNSKVSMCSQNWMPIKE